MRLTSRLSKPIYRTLLLLTGLFTLCSLPVFADAKLASVDQAIRAALAVSRPDINVASVKRSEMNGLYAVSIGEGPTLYFSEKGRHFILGDLFRVKKDGLVNVDDLRRNDRRSEQIDSVDLEDMIVFAPAGKPKAVVNVFTDVDCFYCQKLHREVPALNQMGVEVRYLAYPRAGIGSDSYKKIASAWCADNPNDAITRLKNRQVLAENVCLSNPVGEQFMLGQKVGVRGTPAMVLESGEMLPGYMSAQELGRRLGIN